MNADTSTGTPSTQPTDWVERAFPGRGDELVTDQEWDRADAVLAAALAHLNADPALTLHRTNPNRTCDFSPYRGNRAHLRSQVRRQLLRCGFSA